MPRVHFTADHSHVPHPMQAVAYKAGATYLVSQAVAAEVVLLGRGRVVPSPGENPESFIEPPRLKDAGNGGA